jgi:hypothetical protein
MVMLSFTDTKINFKNRSEYSYREFHNHLWKFEINLGENEAKLHYALLHKDELQKNMGSQRFKNALKVVSDF